MSILFAIAMAASVPAVKTGKGEIYQPSPNSCLIRAGGLKGEATTLPAAVSGAEIKRVQQFNSLIRNLPEDQTLVIDGGDFTGWRFGLRWRFGSRKMTNVCFRRSKLVNTRWSNAKTSGIGFIDSDLTGAQMDKADMAYVLFRNTTLANMNAREASFKFGRFDGSWTPSIANLKLEQANLTGFKFVCGISEADGCAFDRKGLNMRRARLINASIYSFALWDANLSEARIDGVELGADQIGQLKGAVTLSQVVLRGGAFVQPATASEFNALRKVITTPRSEDDRCSAPSDPTMIIVCSDPTRKLLDLDIDLSLLGNDDEEDPKTIKNFGKARNKCLSKPQREAAPCLKALYSVRRSELLAASAGPDWMSQPGQYLFARSDLAIDKDPVAAALWSRFGAVVAGSARAYIAVKNAGNGQIAIRGVSTAGEGARCHVGMDRLSFAAGHFSPVTMRADPLASAEKPRKRKKGGIAPPSGFISFVGETAQIAQNYDEPRVIVEGMSDASRLIRCNGIAPFGKMQQLRVDDAAFAQIWEKSIR